MGMESDEQLKRAFKVVKQDIMGLIGAYEIELHKESAITRRPRGTRSISKKIKLDNSTHKIIARKKIPFLPVEENILAYTALTLEKFVNGENANVYFRSALLSSITDLALGRHLREGASPNWFWSIQQALHTFKGLTFNRYEGAPVTSGCIILSGDYKKFFSSLPKGSLDKVKPKSTFSSPLNATIFQQRQAYRIINGTSAIYVTDSKLFVLGVLKIQHDTTEGTVDKLWGESVAKALESASQNSFAIIANNSLEVEIITQRNDRFIWRRGAWKLFSEDSFINFLSPTIEESTAKLIAKISYSMSKTRHGTILLIPDDETSYIDGFLQRPVTDETSSPSRLTQWIISTITKQNISTLLTNRDIINILSTDGTTVFNKRGLLINTGIMAKITDESQLHGGARTAAAKSASQHGRVVKISEDGPIEFYYKGDLICTIG